MGIFFLFVLLIAAIAAVALVYAGITGSREPRYQGEAPHKGKVMRFTGTSSEVKDDSGNQHTTQV
jgi:hypothetical protein